MSNHVIKCSYFCIIIWRFLGCNRQTHFSMSIWNWQLEWLLDNTIERVHKIVSYIACEMMSHIEIVDILLEEWTATLHKYISISVFSKSLTRFDGATTKIRVYRDTKMRVFIDVLISRSDSACNITVNTNNERFKFLKMTLKNNKNFSLADNLVVMKQMCLAICLFSSFFIDSVSGMFQRYNNIIF